MNNLLFSIMSSILIFLSIIYFMRINVDTKKYFDYFNQLKTDSFNRNFQLLKNGSTFLNLPKIDFITDDKDIKNFEKCAETATYLGPINDTSDYLKQCYITCGGSGKLLIINPGDEVYYYNKYLETGVYCVTQLEENCNRNTSILIAGVNGSVCRPKYPELFAGENGTTLVACTDTQYNYIPAILWDEKYNEQVSPYHTNFSSKGAYEKWNGKYRFTCRWPFDLNLNAFQINPLNHLHPIRDYCTSHLYKSNPNIGTKWITDNENKVVDYYCDCGNKNETRVENYQNNKKNYCISSSCIEKLEFTKNKNAAKKQFVIQCYNALSPESAIFGNPAPPKQFLTNISNCYSKQFILSISQFFNSNYIKGVPDNLKFVMFYDFGKEQGIDSVVFIDHSNFET